MGKYIMLQAPVERPGEINQILILDPATFAGKHYIEKFYSDGWQKVGEVESEKSANFLTDGLTYDMRRKLEEVSEKFGMIEKLASNYASEAQRTDSAMVRRRAGWQEISTKSTQKRSGLWITHCYSRPSR